MGYFSSMKKRLLFETIKKHLKKKQISLIIGARQTGKTTLMQQLQYQVNQENLPSFFLTLEDPKILSILNEHPGNLLQVLPPLNDKIKTYIFIDEIQYLKDPSNFLKYHYDTSTNKIKFIVSGSSSFYIDTKFKDSLAGRKRIFKLPTLSFEEFLIFKDKAELSSLLYRNTIPHIYKNELSNLQNEYMIYGGYPDVVLEPDYKEKQLFLAEIAESYVKKDAVEAGLKHPDAYLNILSFLSEITGSLLNNNSIAANFKLNSLIIESYIRLMKKSFHITTVKPFYRNMTKELRKMPKVFFSDLGLRNHFINNFENVLLRDDKGALFENFVFRLFYDKIREDGIKFWRTQKQQEIDFIINSNKAFEVKFSASSYKQSKYTTFKKSYPDIPLQLIHYENVLQTDYDI